MCSRWMCFPDFWSTCVPHLPPFLYQTSVVFFVRFSCTQMAMCSIKGCSRIQKKLQYKATWSSNFAAEFFWNMKQPSYMHQNLLKVATLGMKSSCLSHSLYFGGKLQNFKNTKQCIRLPVALLLEACGCFTTTDIHITHYTPFLHDYPTHYSHDKIFISFSKSYTIVMIMVYVIS